MNSASLEVHGLNPPSPETEGSGGRHRAAGFGEDRVWRNPLLP